MAKVSYFDGSELRLFSGIVEAVKDSQRLPSGVSTYTTTMANPASEGSTGFISSPLYSFANMFSAVTTGGNRVVAQAWFGDAFPFDCLFVFAPVQSGSEKYGFVGCGAATKGSHYATIAGIANVTLDSVTGPYGYIGSRSLIDDYRGHDMKVAVYCFPMTAKYATGIKEVKLDE